MLEKRCLGQQDGLRGHRNTESTLQEMALPVLSTDALILARRSPAMRCGVTGRGASLPLLSRGKKFDILWGDRSLKEASISSRSSLLVEGARVLEERSVKGLHPRSLESSSSRRLDLEFCLESVMVWDAMSSFLWSRSPSPPGGISACP